MRPDQHDHFWSLYQDEALPVIERACRSASRRLSEGQIDADDMLAWVNERVWKMLSRDRAPTFHDDPSPEVAVERLKTNARTLARWAYLGLCRAHWRRGERRREYIEGLSQAERMAMVSRDNNESQRLEQHEQVRAELSKVREQLDSKLRAKLAASWPRQNERARIAKALGATDDAAEALIERVSEGDMQRNAVEQMRSRARRTAQERLAELARGSLIAVTAALMGLVVFAAPAKAGGEQGGGRGGKGMVAPHVESLHGQSAIAGGQFVSASYSSGGEQGGGRGG